jgi:hypothetical protein
MSFTRQPAECWHREVPGARWLKADLHIHTIDDRAGPKAKLPPSFVGDPHDPEALSRYAKLFLKALVARGIQVAALTPHCPKVGIGPETSAVWKIVEQWNSGNDDDGVPFREKIYALFPGFEPSLADGQAGLHLLFLFDPEIGRDCYLQMFDRVMAGIAPWRDKVLQISSKGTDAVFDELAGFWSRACPRGDSGDPLWSYLVLAPHIDGDKGLLKAQKAQKLALFDHGKVAALELGDEKLPTDALRDRTWLRDGMSEHRQAFFHSSDAYSLDELGQRYTWVKLATPRIEALRQAFVASDSRVRIAFERGPDEKLREIADPPDVMLTRRPWLRRLAVEGEASFFGHDRDGLPPGEEFSLSPDLTCVIGGSMTGKSTLLDGLRVQSGAPLPLDDVLRKRVARACERFSAGAARVELDCPGTDPTAPAAERWPAQFFAQGELQRLAQETGAVEDILARLVPEETGAIERYKRELAAGDARLHELARQLAAQDEDVSAAEQAESRARSASEALVAFAKAGVDDLHRVAAQRHAFGAAVQEGTGLAGDVAERARSATALELPELDPRTVHRLRDLGVDLPTLDLGPRIAGIAAQLAAAGEALGAWLQDAERVAGALREHEDHVRIDVERRLAERGFAAEKIKEFQDLSRQARLLPSYRANLEESRRRRDSAEGEFERLRGERDALVAALRDAFTRVVERVARDFESKIHVRRLDSGDASSLDAFVRDLRQKGVTQWWNGLEDEQRPDPGTLLAHLLESSLAQLGMSPTVSDTFRESLTKARRHELAALRSLDSYSIELRLDDGSYRRLEELSGGQRVSVLLSLLLETADDRPLVIDQPEDELDNRFLLETVLPALKKLKGRRQVIVATHNANIVVNGDADLVIQLAATARHGWVETSGAIEAPAVRDAIVRTVDGGEEAFRLRRRKYGF